MQAAVLNGIENGRLFLPPSLSLLGPARKRNFTVVQVGVEACSRVCPPVYLTCNEYMHSMMQ
jgi:hypothetical protein